MHDHKTPTRHAFLPTLLLSVAFGFSAGAVGMLVAFAYALPEPSIPGSTTVPRGAVAPGEEPAPAADVARSAVLFFDKVAIDRLASKDLAASLLPSEAFGSGFTLTSDGWIVAHVSSFPKGRLPVGSYAVIGGRPYPVRQSVADPFSDVLFLRVEAAGLPVAAFGAAEDLLVGGSAFAFDRHGGIRRLGVVSFDDLAVATTAELRWSSESIQEAVHLSGAEGLLPGAMILARDGGVAGVYAGEDTQGAYAIPLESFSRVIGGVLKDGKTGRPFLGIRYFDLSRSFGTGPAGRGALLVPSADGKLPAVARRSPAEVAGLRAGDVIEAVNGQEVSAKVALSDLLAEYAPGDKVMLTIARDGKSMRVEVTLGAASTED